MLVILPKDIKTLAKLVIRYKMIRIEYLGYAVTLSAIILLAFYVTGSKVLRILRRKVSEC